MSGQQLFDDERIDDLHAGLFEIRPVTCRDDQAVHESACGDEAVLDRHRASGCPERGQQFRPARAEDGFTRQAVQAPDALIEPTLEPRTALSFRQQQNAEPDLTEDERIDRDLGFVPSEPSYHVEVRRDLGRLAQDVCIDEEFHSASVDSDSIGTKKSFTGHARNQSTTASSACVGPRTSRYPPRSIRSTSNSCTASIRSRCRISAGSTICPFDETVVLIHVRYRLTCRWSTSRCQHVSTTAVNCGRFAHTRAHAREVTSR